MTHPWPESAALLAPLLPWFQAEGRRLPWRAEDLSGPHPDPYAVLVSELMLQQTQVATVIPYFERWMLRFPDAASLAQADEDEVHKLWEGLGYYRRARQLQAAARIVAEDGWPEDQEGLIAMPGLGPYTAAAVASIAFQRPEAALDGNAFRVLARLLGLEEDPRSLAPELRDWLRPALRTLGPSRLTQGLMELGARVCTPRPDCGACPLAVACQAFLQKRVDRIPPRRQRPEPRSVELLLLAIQADGQWLLQRPGRRGLLAGLWRWPAVQFPEAAAIDTAAESLAPYHAMEAQTWPVWIQTYSHRKERVTPLRLDLAESFGITDDLAWVPTLELPRLPMGKRDQRLRILLEGPGHAYAGPMPALPGRRR